MTDGQTIGELCQQVPTGETRIFKPSRDDLGEERFFAVSQNWNYYPGRLTWSNKPGLMENPWYGSRFKARIPISAIPVPEVSFEGPASDLVDFYSTSADCFFLSERLCDLIEELDPGSLDQLPITIAAEDGAVPYRVVMPARSLEAVDVARTTVVIQDEKFASDWVRYIRFPLGIVFKGDALAGIHSFSDYDALAWYWSQELIDLAKASKIKGLEADSVRAKGPTVVRL